MPSLKPPSSFPGVDKLPSSAQAIIETLFPADVDASIAAPMTVVPGLTSALKPLSGGLARAREIIPEIMDMLKTLKLEKKPMSKPARAFVKNIDTEINTANPLHILEHEKINSRVPSPADIITPEGFSQPPSMRPKRDPLIDELYTRQLKFDKIVGPKQSSSATLRAYTAPTASGGDALMTAMTQRNAPVAKKPLSGRWSGKTGTNVAGQARHLGIRKAK